MSGRKPYRSDLSDEQWALIEPVIAAWKAGHRSVSGHTGRYEMREIVNALLYQSRTGCQWDYLPHDLPPRGAVYYYFAKWRDDGTDQTVHDLLRWQVRESRGREADPSLVVLDTQSVHVAAGVPATTIRSTSSGGNARVSSPIAIHSDNRSSVAGFTCPGRGIQAPPGQAAHQQRSLGPCF